MVLLRGTTWDHPRGVAPLLAATREYQKSRPDIQISWDVRSLKEFEDYPIDLLAEKYDLLLIDHPFIGRGVEKEIILPLDEWISAEYLADQKANSVGESYGSYTWNGKQWALAVDAASQVSAYRADLVAELGLQVPRTWSDVLELASHLPNGRKIGIPLNPTHSFCSFLALSANFGGANFWRETTGIDSEVAEEALDFLKRLVPLVHESSMSMNPIQMSDLMSNSNEIVYVPLMFGYSNYARDGFTKHTLHFTNIPSTHAEPAGGVLGGVGLAISTHSKHKRQATDFTAYVGGGECQTGFYFESGGQPGYRQAWTNSDVNQRSSGFFENTLRTLDNAFMRPRYSGYVPFQEHAAEIIHQFLRNGGNRREVVGGINNLYDRSRTQSL